MSSKSNERESLGSAGDNISVTGGRWTFGASVPENFDSHVRKSVPIYEQGHKLTVKLSDFFVKEGSFVYELGSSTGTLISSLAEKHQDLHGTKFVGVESEEKMIDIAIDRHKSIGNLSFQQSRAEEFEYEKCDLIVSHYTIQFIQPKYRQVVFDKIFNALEWGGAIIMYEKVRANDARFNEFFTTLYSEFKLEQGYSHQEILSKTLSLKGVLEPFSSEANIDLMKRAGFRDIISIHKFLCFEGWLAIK